MKTRSGFVSNSSSSSFVLDMDHLSAVQVEKIREHVKYGKEMGIPYAGEPYSEWSVEVKPHHIKLWTGMDNFDMGYFLEAIGVPDEAIIHRGS